MITVSALSHEQMRQRLAELENKPVPKNMVAAMCYKMASIADHAEYLCPACGERSLYTNDRAVASLVVRDLDAMRVAFPQLTNIAPVKLALDESALCVKCSPNSTARRDALTVSYPDGTTKCTQDMCLFDPSLLTAFFRGETTVSYRGTSPLKDSLPRLRKLLGVSYNAPLPQPDKKN